MGGSTEVLTIGNGKDYRHLSHGDIPVFGTGGYMTSVNSFLFEGQSVCIGRKGSIDKPQYLEGKFWTVDTLFYTHSFKKSIPFFIYQVFLKINWKRYNEASGVPSLSKSTIEKIPILLPSLPEQQKIADFLSRVDRRIELLEEKKGLLDQYKRGVMQKIFSQEIRFKDDNGDDFPEWEEKRLGEICKITTGKLDANAMRDKGSYPFFTCAKLVFRIDNYAFNTEALLISGNGANVGYIHYFKGKFNAYQRTYVLDQFTQNIQYTKFFLDKNLPVRIKRERKEGNTPYIVMDTLALMKMTFPSLPEQQKIADFLSAIDRKIEAVAGQIEAMKEWKKGLLQGMFL